jgi:uncharacterized membrane protein YccC
LSLVATERQPGVPAAVNARGAVVSVTLALACLASYSLVRYASAQIHSLSHADDLVGGLWAVIATAFVFRTTDDESVTTAKTRVAATALSFALCFVYLLFLPFYAWGLAALIAVCTLLMISLGHSGDVGVAAITTGAVMVVAALGPQNAWQKPLIGVAGTAVGIAIGLAASWLANGKLVDGLRRDSRGGTIAVPLMPCRRLPARSRDGGAFSAPILTDS